MDLDELIVSWKQQDTFVKDNLRLGTLRHLLKIKSNHTLVKIRVMLLTELTLIVLAILLFDGLYFLVKIKMTLFRWFFFTGFNLVLLLYVITYVKMLWQSRLTLYVDLKENLQRIVTGLTLFRKVYLLCHIPVTVICFLMFFGAFNLTLIIPWMICEYLLLRWIWMGKISRRFGAYIADLDYSLNQLRSID